MESIPRAAHHYDELSHTFVDTADHGYGDAGAQALAVGVAPLPLQALCNADNYQYFVEKAFMN